jgi:hypothetical protein
LQQKIATRHGEFRWQLANLNDAVSQQPGRQAEPDSVPIEFGSDFQKRPRYIQHLFHREIEYSMATISYIRAELLSRAEEPV